MGFVRKPARRAVSALEDADAATVANWRRQGDPVVQPTLTAASRAFQESRVAVHSTHVPGGCSVRGMPKVTTRKLAFGDGARREMSADVLSDDVQEEWMEVAEGPVL